MFDLGLLLFLGTLVVVGIQKVVLVLAQRRIREPAGVGGEPGDSGGGGPPPQNFMRVVVSVVVLGAALYIILSAEYPAETDKWAYGSVGTIVGYWLAP